MEEEEKKKTHLLTVEYTVKGIKPKLIHSVDDVRATSRIDNSDLVFVLLVEKKYVRRAHWSIAPPRNHVHIDRAVHVLVEPLLCELSLARRRPLVVRHG